MKRMVGSRVHESINALLEKLSLEEASRFKAKMKQRKHWSVVELRKKKNTKLMVKGA